LIYILIGGTEALRAAAARKQGVIIFNFLKINFLNNFLKIAFLNNF
jgi:hypothetical protein